MISQVLQLQRITLKSQQKMHVIIVNKTWKKNTFALTGGFYF